MTDRKAVGKHTPGQLASLPRYDWDRDGGMVADPTGEYVLFSDVQSQELAFAYLLATMQVLHQSLKQLSDCGDAGQMVNDDVDLARAAIARATGGDV